MAVRKYSSVATVTNTASATLPMLNFTGTTAIRMNITEWKVGSSATPADNSALYKWQRSTTTGTAGSNFTPIALDPGDPAAVTVVGLAVFSVGPTLTANNFMDSASTNMRATWRYVMQPAYGMVAPATASNGIALLSITVGGSAVSTDFQVYHEE